MVEKSKLENVWGQREAGIDIDDIDKNGFRPITHQDVQILLQKYPFLQMVNSEALFENYEKPKFITAKNGWVIHDYDDALSSSPGEFLYGKGEKEEDEGGEGSGGAVESAGTIIKQMVDAAMAMVEIAVEKKWKGIFLVDGTELMKWAAWYAAQEKGISLTGYEPDEEAKRKRDRIRKHLIEKTAAPTLEI